MFTPVTDVTQIKGKWNRMKIVYYGHSSFAVEINGKHLLFDPFITQNPLAKAVDIKIKADYILVSHAHYDHILDTAAIADQTGATVISNYDARFRVKLPFGRC